MSFGERLKILRSEKNVTQQQLAEFLGVGRPTIAGYETKGKQPDFAIVIEIAGYFNVSIDFLLGVSHIRNAHNKDFIELTTSAHCFDASDLPAEDVEKVKEYIELLRQKYNNSNSRTLKEE